jgi:FMN-dependent NADH-azoreductase
MMPALLAIGVSPRYEHSTSRKLTSLFVEKWRAAHPAGQVVERDLVKTYLPFVDLPWIGGAFTPPDQHSPESAAAIKISDDLVAELRAADRIVIGTPMYNFSIPAVLKAYIDHVVRVGVTVVDNVGQLTGKKATIILASGGDFSPGSPFEGYNQASGYLRQVLGFIGITDLDIILAGRARAGLTGETAVEEFGDEVGRAAAA